MPLSLREQIQALEQAVDGLNVAAADAVPYDDWGEAKWKVVNAAVRLVRENRAHFAALLADAGAAEPDKAPYQMRVTERANLPPTDQPTAGTATTAYGAQFVAAGGPPPVADPSIAPRVQEIRARHFEISHRELTSAEYLWHCFRRFQGLFPTQDVDNLVLVWRNDFDQLSAAPPASVDDQIATLTAERDDRERQIMELQESIEQFGDRAEKAEADLADLRADRDETYRIFKRVLDALDLHGAWTEDRLLALVRDLRASSGWRPMETAPKDGTAIQVWARDLRFPGNQCVAQYIKSDIEWWHVTDGKFGPWPLRGPSPTHWMPLPASPSPEPIHIDREVDPWRRVKPETPEEPKTP